jgi:hypothetical protein
MRIVRLTPLLLPPLQIGSWKDAWFVDSFLCHCKKVNQEKMRTNKCPVYPMYFQEEFVMKYWLVSVTGCEFRGLLSWIVNSIMGFPPAQVFAYTPPSRRFTISSLCFSTSFCVAVIINIFITIEYVCLRLGTLPSWRFTLSLFAVEYVFLHFTLSLFSPSWRFAYQHLTALLSSLLTYLAQ